MTEEAKYEGLEPITLRKCDIARLKKKLARVRAKRDAWKLRAITAEEILSAGAATHWYNRSKELSQQIDSMRAAAMAKATKAI